MCNVCKLHDIATLAANNASMRLSARAKLFNEMAMSREQFDQLEMKIELEFLAMPSAAVAVGMEDR